jgi:hypothetical protein
MKRILIFSIGLACLVSCEKMDISSSQADSFLKFYNTFSVFRGADAREVPGKGYVMLGTVTTANDGDQICLIRTDKYGNSIDSAFYYGGTRNETAYGLEVLDNKDMIILGSTVNTAGKLQPYLIHTDSAGKVLKQLIIKTTDNSEALKFRINPQGSIYMVGYIDTARVGSKLSRDIMLFAVDKNFNYLWSKPRPIGFENEDKGTDLQLLPDGRIFVTGYTTNPDGKRHAFALRTGSNGLGGSLFEIDGDQNEGNCIEIIDENTFIIAGTTYKNATQNATDVMMDKITYTSTGVTKQWEKNFGGKLADYGNCIMMDGDKLHLLTTMGSAGTNSTISMISTDLDGNDPVYSNFGEGSKLSATTFSMTSDFGFIIAGTNERSTNDVSMTVIKLNAGGSLH